MCKRRANLVKSRVEGCLNVPTDTLNILHISRLCFFSCQLLISYPGLHT